MKNTDLVSVVIPAYNAESTLDETLRSVRTQTHQSLEIIVVDDGSSDATSAIAERHAAVDARVQLLKQDNAGVAVARNTGWQHATSDYIAFVDADDLWAPTKIEKQLHALLEGGEQVGLVYCWYVRIDSDSLIFGSGPFPLHQGDVLEHIFLGNFIGNGSSVLVRRQALIDAAGFAPELRAAGAEGCEDFLFYCRVAEKHHFAVVPERLLGYRLLPNNMSSNRPKMLHSWMLVVDEMKERHPTLIKALKSGLINYSKWIILDVIKHNTKQLPAVMRLILSKYPSIALKLMLKDIPVTIYFELRKRMIKQISRQTVTSKAPKVERFFVGKLD